jgi:hypothetical protein
MFPNMALTAKQTRICDLFAKLDGDGNGICES